MAHSWGSTSAGGAGGWGGGSHAGSSVNPRLKLVREDQEAPCGGKH